MKGGKNNGVLWSRGEVLRSRVIAAAVTYSHVNQVSGILLTLVRAVEQQKHGSKISTMWTWSAAYFPILQI